MVRRRHDIATFMEAGAGDPGLEPLLREGAAAVVWDEAGRRPAWASPAAAPFVERLALDGDGALESAVPAAARLRALAGGLAPRAGTRLEKLRFAPSALVPFATCACRLVALPTGEEVLLTAFIGALPALPARPPRPAPPAEPVVDAPVQEAPPAGPADGSPSEAATFLGQEIAEAPAESALPVEAVPDLGLEPPDPDPVPVGAPVGAEPEPLLPEPPVDPLEHLRDRGTVRFLWQADAAGRFVAVSEALASIVGPENADIVGRTWGELADRVEDPSGIVAEHLARGETWSNRAVFWRIGATDFVVPVDLAGIPVRDRERALLGFRGFGLIRTGAVVERPRPAAPEPVPVAGTPSVEAPQAAAPVLEPPAPEPAPEAPAAAEGAGEQAAAEPTPLVTGEPEPAGQRPEGGEAALVEDDVAPALADADAAPRPDAPVAVLAGDEAGTGDVLPVGEQTETQPAEAAASSTPDDAALQDAAPVDDPTAPDAVSGKDDPAAGEPAPASDEIVAAEAAGEPPAMDPAPDTSGPAPGPVHDEPANDTAPAAFSDLAVTAGGSFATAWSARAEHPREPETGAALVVDAPEPAPSAPPPEAGPESLAEAVRSSLSAAEASPARPASAASNAMARLSTAERNAFREIARALGARFEDEGEPAPAADEPAPAPASPPEALAEAAAPRASGEPSATQVLARLPLGVLVHRGEEVVHANRALLDLLDYETTDALAADGGLAKLFRGRAGLLARSEVETPAPVPLATRSGEVFAAEIRHAAVDWDGEAAGLMLVRRVPDGDPAFRLRALETELRGREGKVRELASILDTATDGVVVVDDVGRVLSLNRSAEALFGFEQNEVVGEAFTALLAPESHVTALDYLEGLRANGVASLLNDGREVLGRVRQGGFIPLFMTMGRVNDGLERKFCAVLRDITAFKKAEGELLAAKRAAEAASAQKSDFLATISHEVRTPLNAIIGFAEVMLEERFGPVGSERYKDYLRDIHASGEHVISLVNDLLDLAKVEAGRMEMAFTSVSLNELVTHCVGLMQPEAVRARIVLRTSFSGKLPPVVADERSVRQIVLNLLSNAVKFTDAGGQVIVSTALTDRGEVAFRVRDTGIGMTETEIEAALEPFRQLATARRGGGTGLGLPLTKALVEANRGMLQIQSTKSEGTLVEVVFPPTRVLAE